jgi:protein TonB
MQMAYLDGIPDPRRRTTAITGVIAVHALLGYVLVTGLVSHFAPTIDKPLVGGTIALPPPPPPQPQETRQPVVAAATPTAPEQPIDLTRSVDRVEVTPEKDTVDVTPTPTGTYPSRPATADLKPTAAAPRNTPARWVTTDDYPSRDLRQGHEGTTAFRLVIGSNGRVSACEVVRSSGYPGLDAATCKAVTARARFEPATDESGARILGTYSNSVRWQIPR